MGHSDPRIDIPDPKLHRSAFALTAVAVFFLLIQTLASGPWILAGDSDAPIDSSTGTSVPNTVSGEPLVSLTIIPEEQAATLAQAWVSSKTDQILEWQGARVAGPAVYVNLDGWPTAYVFSVYRGPRSAGYVIVSYEAEEHPILEFSTSPAPHALCDVNCRGAAARRGLTLNTQRPIYLGPLAYYFEAVGSASVQGDAQRTFVHMSGDYIAQIDRQPLRDLPGQIAASPELLGKLMDEPELVRKIYGVPDYGQFFGPSFGYDFSCFSGCTPTAATNLARFWADAGYPGLGDAYWPDTTVDLRRHMDTFCYGTAGTTLLHKIAPGMIAFAAERGYDFQSLQYCWPADENWVGCNQREFTWQRYSDEIDGCRPALMAISNHPLYGDHTVTGIGYDTSNGGYYIVHDNWGSTPREVWIQHEQSVDRPRFLFPLIPPTLDQAPPSHVEVAPLPPFQANTKFDVAWTGVDSFPGVGSFDVQYRDGTDGEWQWWLRGTTATAGRLSDDVDLIGGHVYYLRVRARDKHCNVSDWFTSSGSAADAAPPITAVVGQPRYRSAGPIPVAWDGTDDAAGIDRFDIWVSSAEDVWNLWQTSSSASSEVFTDAAVNATYRFISIGTDRLGREEVKDPESPDTVVTIARHSVRGLIAGNTGQPVYRATVNSPGAYVTDTTHMLGHYALFFPQSQPITLTVSGSATFGTLPPMTGLELTDTITDLYDVDLVLPPSDNLLQDSHFEEPDPTVRWMPTGIVTPAHTRHAHTGDFALALGALPEPARASASTDSTATGRQHVMWQWAISQTVSLPPTLASPTLSWVYAISGTANISDTFTVGIQSSAGPTTASIPAGPADWVHGWMALDEAMVGDLVTVSFALRRKATTDQLSVFLDEVTLGSGHRGPTQRFLPLINR